MTFCRLIFNKTRPYTERHRRIATLLIEMADPRPTKFSFFFFFCLSPENRERIHNHLYGVDAERRRVYSGKGLDDKARKSSFFVISCV